MNDRNNVGGCDKRIDNLPNLWVFCAAYPL